MNQAQEAVKKYNEAEKKEKEEIENLLNKIDYIQEDTNTIAKELKIGDYVAYGDKLEINKYSTKTDETGYANPQEFQTDKTIAWRVMNIMSNGKVEIVATKNTTINGGKTGLYLRGKTGFLNAKKVLSDACERLYTSSYGKARNITVEDINQLTGYKPNKPQKYTYSTGWAYYDKTIDAFRTPSLENPVVVDATTYVYTINQQTPLYDSLMSNTYCPAGDYNVTSNMPEHYWLFDNCINCEDEVARFGWRTVNASKIDGVPLVAVHTDGSAGEMEFAQGIRVVVTLSDNVRLDHTNSKYDGSSAENAWRLK